LRKTDDARFLKQIAMTTKHEYGHTIQSMIFGPLYLIVVGLPSVMQNIIGVILLRRFDKHEYSYAYYNRYPEKWADRLGGVEKQDRIDFGWIID